MYYIMGLGNPGEEYEKTRHNTGRVAVEAFDKKTELSEKKFKIIIHEGFMNKSGDSIKPLLSKIKTKKKVYPVGKRSLSYGAEKLIVIYDDIDLPLGSFKIAFNRGSGGHKGLESIIRSVKTKEFVRVRIGITPTTPSGKLKKPGAAFGESRQRREKKILDFIIGDFRPKELEILKKVFRKTTLALETIITFGHPKAMSLYN